MKKMLKIVVILTLFLVITSIINTNVMAKEKIELTSNSTKIEKDETVHVTIKINNPNVASYTISIYSDFSKLEYINPIQNSNFSNHRIIYTWVAEDFTKIAEYKKEITLDFKGINEGTSTIMVMGEFYNTNGESIYIDSESILITIGKEQIENQGNIILDEQTTKDTGNANLAIMRLNQEAVSPDFKNDIYEYYVIVGETISSLDITAIPENKNAKVHIFGNKNLKIGLNEIEIKVESEDKTKTNSYKIYITKTANKELANANLMTFAIKQANLYPSFDPNTLNYNIEVSKDISQIDILAIPEKQNAKVEIQGDMNLQIGDNIFEIFVTAENGITKKKYTLIAHRRNETEEIIYEQESKLQTEKLEATIEMANHNELLEQELQEKYVQNTIIVIILVVITGIGFIIFLKIYKNIKGKNKKT